MTGLSVVEGVTYIANLDDISLQVSWTGTAFGLIEVLCSNDGINYDALSFDPPIPQPTGTNAKYLIALIQVPSIFLKVQYTNSSGVGVLDVTIAAKDLN